MSDIVEFIPQIPPEATLIWCHGLGADGYDFYPIAEALQRPGFALKMILPHANLRSVTLNGGMTMRAWYDILGLGERFTEDCEGIESSRQRLEKMILTEKNAAPDRPIFLGGFSQGGAIALHTGLRLSVPLAGIIGFSTYLPLAAKLNQEKNPVNQNTPILLAHGDFDPIIPCLWGKKSLAFLQESHYRVEWITYPMEHQVCDAEILKLQSWLQTCLY